MKTSLLHLGLVALTLIVADSTGFTAQTNTTTTASSSDLGYDLYQGRTNKIESVYSVTPSHVRVRYENGGLSRPIARTELNDELARLYPYQAEKAAAYTEQKTTEEAQRRSAELAVWQAAQKARQASQFNALVAEIAILNARDVELQKQINALRGMRRGNGRKVQLQNLRTEQQGIRERVLKLQAQQSALRS